MLKLFNCNVRLGGNVLCDVPKYGLTEMELRVLQAIHGDDAVIHIKKAGEVDRTEQDEASRLAADYPANIVSAVSGIQSIAPLEIEDDDEPAAAVPAVETVAEQPVATDKATTTKATKAAIE